MGSEGLKSHCLVCVPYDRTANDRRREKLQFRHRDGIGGACHIQIPEYAGVDTGVHLHCRYDLGEETLYSVRIYKDGKEFLRYLPEKKPLIAVFELLGVVLNVSSLALTYTSTDFDLSKVNPSSSGRYKCEVTGEAPEFKTAAEEAEMTEIPEIGPLISGEQYTYQIGDTLKVNCTYGSSIGNN